jgi:protease-4
MSACFTLVFLGFVGLVHISSKIMDTGFSESVGAEKGNIGIVEVVGPIISSKKIII